jgi:hypothetical protein
MIETAATGTLLSMGRGLMSLSRVSSGRRSFTTSRSSVPASFSQHRLCLCSQVFRGIHVLADTSREIAIDMLFADQLVKSLALSRLLEGTFQRFDLRSALFMATLLVHKHELPINRGQLGFECLVVTGDEKLRGH